MNIKRMYYKIKQSIVNKNYLENLCNLFKSSFKINNVFNFKVTMSFRKFLHLSFRKWSFRINLLFFGIRIGFYKGYKNSFEFMIFTPIFIFIFDSYKFKEKFLKLIPHIYLILLTRELVAHEFMSHSVCSDPMNGCPEDFAEDFGRYESKLEYRIISLNCSQKWEIFWYNFFYNKEQKKFDANPVPW